MYLKVDFSLIGLMVLHPNVIRPTTQHLDSQSPGGLVKNSGFWAPSAEFMSQWVWSKTLSICISFEFQDDNDAAGLGLYFRKH